MMVAMDIEPETCRMAVRIPGQEKTSCCGNPAISGSPWCANHAPSPHMAPKNNVVVLKIENPRQQTHEVKPSRRPYRSLHSSIAWTDERRSMVADLWKQGIGSGDIAKRLNISRSAVMGMVRRLGLMGKGGLHQKTKSGHRKGIPLSEAPAEAWRQAIIPNLMKELSHIVDFEKDFFIGKALLYFSIKVICPKVSDEVLREAIDINQTEFGRFSLRARMGNINFNAEKNDVEIAMAAGVIAGVFKVTGDDSYFIGDQLA